MEEMPIWFGSRIGFKTASTEWTRCRQEFTPKRRRIGIESNHSERNKTKDILSPLHLEYSLHRISFYPSFPLPFTFLSYNSLLSLLRRLLPFILPIHNLSLYFSLYFSIPRSNSNSQSHQFINSFRTQYAMKFGKSLSNQIEETLPEWRDKFLSYKDLKKRLKLIERPAKRARVADEGSVTSPAADEGVSAMTREEIDFMRLLEEELDKFNSFFVEKEEEYIIRQKELQDRVRRVVGKESKEELMKVRKEIVDFHGEMVLLENYSALNYTGLVKILKKYDKRTGALIRLPFIQKVLQQPFFTTDLLYKLVKECEAMLDRLFPTNEPSFSGENGSTHPTSDPKTTPVPPSPSMTNGTVGIPGLEEIENMESMYMKSTVAALRALKEIRSKSSTVSVFSLPPLQSNVLEESWTKVPVLEQTAK
ncbi:hypothetical protein LUZ61_015817 [Rhynchospora tenuis]|uniref:SPX domain-containing protein n=1 Tax=Rhynchospora tenuis TaxID=198213 RepID=A0AAD5Z4C9_9POAL|nr:hypothetical protein LUZ61_015817 [Rhynchospora tenuis]